MVASSFARAGKRAKRTGLPYSSRPLPAPDSLSADRRALLLCCLALIGAVLASYYPVIHNGFVHYDDNLYITDNPQVRAGITATTLAWAFTTFDQANWHPLTWLSHALDCELFGLNPVAHHGVNVLLHAANAVLLFLLLQRATGFRWRSLMVAALFTLHPLNVESVAWAAERKNVLSMLFFLLAFHAYTWYARQPGGRRYAAVVCFYALALMAKPQVITFPFLLLLWDYWPLARIGALDNSGSEPRSGSLRLEIRPLLLEKVPLLLLSAASALLTLDAQQAGGAVRTLTRYSLPVRLETALVSYVRYLGKVLWPSKLVAMYPHPMRLYPAWQVGGAVVLMLLITVLVIRAREQRYLLFGWLWFLGSLVPMIGLVQVGDQALADRYAYIPFIGLFAMFVWLIADWANARGIVGRWLAVPAVACLLALGILTVRQVPYWHDTESFWRRTIALTEDNYVAHGELAALLHEQGKTEEAIEQIRAVLAIRPDDAPANLVLAEYERSRGDFPAAIERYQAVAQHSAGTAGVRARAYASLGSTYRQMGQPMKAKESYEMSLQLAPNQPRLIVTLGVMAEAGGDLPAAVQQYSRAIAAQPTDVGYLLLAHALQQEGRTNEAKAAFEHAVSISSNLPQAEEQAKAILAGK
jgi:protein O-mannosyl-transferase